MPNYIDGFVVPVPKKNLARYLKMATLAAKVWIEHGALEYYEYQGEDVQNGKVTSFPMSVKLKKGEVVFFSWAVYKSRKHRDQVLKKVMQDSRMNDSDPESWPFDGMRMIYGGFKSAVIKVKKKK